MRLGDAVYHPDLLFVCGSAVDRHYEADLTFVVEVLSPSTEAFDRRGKAVASAGAPSFDQYLLVDPDRRRIEVATRGPAELRWQAHGPGSLVITRFGDLVLDDLYDEVDATATT